MSPLSSANNKVTTGLLIFHKLYMRFHITNPTECLFNYSLDAIKGSPQSTLKRNINKEKYKLIIPPVHDYGDDCGLWVR